MTGTEPMNVNERRKYLHKMRIRYWQAASKSAKRALLDEMQSVTSLHRKSVLRLITGELARQPRRNQCGKNYGAKVKAVVEKIAHSLDSPCAERLQPNLVWMAKHLDVHGEIELNPDLQTKLERISVWTVRRLLPPSQRNRSHRPFEKTTERQLRPPPGDPHAPHLLAGKHTWAFRGGFGASLWHKCLRAIGSHPANDRRGHRLERVCGFWDAPTW